MCRRVVYARATRKGVTIPFYPVGKSVRDYFSDNSQMVILLRLWDNMLVKKPSVNTLTEYTKLHAQQLRLF
jgi:hypothetical protein